MIRDASRNLRLLVGVLAAFGMVAAMGAIVIVAGPYDLSESGAVTQFGWVTFFIGAALLARWREHGGTAELLTVFALDGATKIAGDLWSDRFNPQRATDGTVYLTWDPAIAPTIAVLVALAIALGFVAFLGVHMQHGRPHATWASEATWRPRQPGTSAVHRWFLDYEPLFGPPPAAPAAPPVPGWPPDATALGKTSG